MMYELFPEHPFLYSAFAGLIIQFILSIGIFIFWKWKETAFPDDLIWMVLILLCSFVPVVNFIIVILTVIYCFGGVVDEIIKRIADDPFAHLKKKP